MNKIGSICARGRPREFCTEQALARALEVFWSKGYEGTSLNDLPEAMVINRPSMYAAFGNKEELFKKALDLYEREKMAYIGKALEQPTARLVAEAMLRGAGENATGGEQPHGCLRVINSVACGAEAESIRDEINARGKLAKAALPICRRIDPFARSGRLLNMHQHRARANHRHRSDHEPHLHRALLQ